MKRLGSEDGFTIIETLVAMVLIAIAFLGLAGVHTVSAKAQSLGNNLGLATHLADQHIEESLRTSFDSIVTTLELEEREGVSFTVVRIVSEIGVAKKVEVLVLWNERLGLRSITLSSLVSQVTNA
ncbi:MAG: prepilin-type N-terminal cleavage/methylation domain-containing protein [Candidatus Binatia bacterium]|nr:prepilin-type N-terminal cleavage/methylation domain-containing protein [Candidatus Binatia bacterium]MDG2010083.1 prepilin-type N-terminal cleavage/methylation domain-containing protein [Candidatus Binatia bacterium]HAC80351.1 hypothetical protein [Deltaproteobacteria bacterium]|tara:strand:+ start:305 stop:679 length:375 start_codon:yes stop_codon:yes gene_type:complete